MDDTVRGPFSRCMTFTILQSLQPTLLSKDIGRMSYHQAANSCQSRPDISDLVEG